MPLPPALDEAFKGLSVSAEAALEDANEGALARPQKDRALGDGVEDDKQGALARGQAQGEAGGEAGASGLRAGIKRYGRCKFFDATKVSAVQATVEGRLGAHSSLVGIWIHLGR